jgi:hypothetical protein
MADVNTAVTLIKSGQKEEAQAILKEIIRTEPHNIPAWFWMVETLETDSDKLRVMEVCLKLNPGDPKVQKAYDMLKEVQAAEAQPIEPTAGEAEGPEKELSAASFSEVPVIQETVDQFAPPPDEPEKNIAPGLTAAVFAASPLVQSAPGQYGSPAPVTSEEKPAETGEAVAGAAAVAAVHAVGQEDEDKSHAAAAAVAVGGMAAMSAAAKPSSAPMPAAEAPKAPPFVEDEPVAPVAAAAVVAPLVGEPGETQAPKPRRKRNWRWLLPAVLISFVVFLCAGISFIYIRQLFP